MKYKKLLVVWLLWIINPLQSIPVKYLKGTYDPLPKVMQHLSPFRGAIWWESGLIENYYRFGFYGKTPPMEYSFYTIRLIKQLFHEVQGSFNITRSPLQTAYHLSPVTIGKILGTIENQKVRYKKALTKAEREKFSKELKEVILKDEDFQKSLALFRPKYEALSVEYKKKKAEEPALIKKRTVLLAASKEEPTGEAKKTIDDIDAQLATIKRLEKEKTTNDVTKAETSELRTFVNAIIGSLEDCGFFPTQIDKKIKKPYEPYYPSYTTQAILLASLYRKAESTDADGVTPRNKQDLKNYFNALFTILKKDFPSEIADPAWLTDIFPDYLEASEALKSVLEKKDINLEKDIIEPFGMEYLNYIQLTKEDPLPNIAQYRRVTVEGFEFPDCAETTMRNLIDIELFSKRERLLDLKNALKGDLDPEIAAFYKKYNALSTIEDIGVHNQWAQLISNRPCIVYFNAIDKVSKKVAYRPNGCMGFVYGLDFEGLELTPVLVAFNDGSKETCMSAMINGGKYIVVDSEKYFLCEVAPSMRNVILLCNQFFGLNLFADQTKAFLEPNFDVTYFPQLISLLGWKIEIPEELQWDKEEIEGKLIAVKITTKDATFELLVQSLTHAQIIAPAKAVLAYQEALFSNLIQAKDIETNIHLLDLIPLYFIFTADRSAFPKRIQFFCYYLCSLRTLSVTTEIIKEIIINKDMVLDPLIASLINFLLHQPDMFYVVRATQVLTKEFIFQTPQTKNAYEFFLKNIINDSGISLDRLSKMDDLFSVLIPLGILKKEELDHVIKLYEDKKEFDFLINFYAILVESSLYIEQAKSLAKKIVLNDKLTKEIMEGLAHLFIKLLKKGQGLEELRYIQNSLISDKKEDFLIAFYTKILEELDSFFVMNTNGLSKTAFALFILIVREIALFEAAAGVGAQHGSIFRDVFAVIIFENIEAGYYLDTLNPSLISLIMKYVDSEKAAEQLVDYLKTIKFKQDKGLYELLKDDATIVKELEDILKK